MSVIPPLGEPSFPSGGPGASFGSAPVQLFSPVAAVAPGAANASPLGSPGAPSAPGPGASFPSVPIFAFEPLNYIGSPTAEGFGQPSGGKGAGPAPDPSLASGSYYFLDEGLSASSHANPLPYGTDGQSLNLGLLPAEHVPTIALPSISGARQFDAHIFRRDFPILQEYVNGRPLIWLDNAATTQKPQAVIDRISHFYAHENSNVHRAAHALAARSTDAFEAAREKVRRFINAPSDKSIVWVRGTTEAVNLVAQAWGRRRR
jgi:cysteine desulfurase/selenocysteine lyase